MGFIDQNNIWNDFRRHSFSVVPGTTFRPEKNFVPATGVIWRGRCGADSPGCDRSRRVPALASLRGRGKKSWGRIESAAAAVSPRGRAAISFSSLNGLFVAATMPWPSPGCTMNGLPTRRPSRRWCNRNKFFILQASLSSELHMLAYQLDRLPKKTAGRAILPCTVYAMRCAKLSPAFPSTVLTLSGEGVSESDRKYVTAGPSNEPGPKTRP